MALNVIKKGGRNGTNIIEHHRNPSGFHNKVNWLLAESAHNAAEMRDLFYNVVYKGPERSKSWWSWVNAYAVARYKLQEEDTSKRLCEFYKQKINEVKERLERKL